MLNCDQVGLQVMVEKKTLSGFKNHINLNVSVLLWKMCKNKKFIIQSNVYLTINTHW